MCTGIRMTAKNGDVVYARTMEFDVPLPGELTWMPRGQQFVGATPTGADGLAWSNAHAYICVLVREVGGTVIDGAADALNEHGLSAGVFNLPCVTEYSDVTDANRAKCLASWQIVHYITGMYDSVKAVREGVARGDFVVAATPFPFATPVILPLHIRVGDRTGETIVLEWHTADQPPTVYDSASGTITNAPDFAYHQSNLEHFKFISPYNPSGPIQSGGSQDYKMTMGLGYVGLPGGSNPPDRFVRAATFARDAYPGDDGEATSWIAWHVMNLFDIPPGLMRDVTADTKAESSEYTLWTTVADTAGLVYYFRGYTDNAIFEVDLKHLDPTATERLVSTAHGGDKPRTIPAFG